ncbi:hypothetical protein PM082_017350 [Marasmius tenuissimus]|nr:hypothetical protein PM082_017350 [Marasmius tenuissimus]
MLSGTAGVGKTAIAMTVAQACEEDGLGASFFFFRSDPKRNNTDFLMPTIALDLLTKFPSLRTFIERQISQSPMILEAHLEDQFRKLVVEPSLQMGRLGLDPESVQKLPILVIIDGLDECGDEDTQQHILSVIQSSYQQPPSTWPPLKFLICSRPEAWIRETFEKEEFSRLTQRVELNKASQTDRDIERYFLHEFRAIRANPKFARLPFPSLWPSKEELQQLMQKASSQFVYATTAVKFVKVPFSNPLDQLHTILAYDPGNQSSNSPFPELDRLYHIILSVNPNREKLLSVLAAILIVPQVPQKNPPALFPTPEAIEFLLCLVPGEVDLTLRAMHSVLNVRGGRDEITVFHTSFRDYLFDRTRSGSFFLEQQAQTHFLARQWLQALSAGRLRRRSYDYQIFEHRNRDLYICCIPFCIEVLQPSQELLADLQNVELSSVFLFQTENPVSSDFSRYLTWEETFNNLVLWLRKANLRDLHPDIIDRLKNRPKRFHLEPSSDQYDSKEDCAEFDHLEHAVILKLNEYRWWDVWGFGKLVEEPSCSFRVTDCRCGSDLDLASSSRRFHVLYEEACLRALRVLVSDASIHNSSRTSSIEGQALFESLVNSSLLQHCAFGTELFAQCHALFESFAARDTLWRIPLAEIKEYQKKLLGWLKTCPHDYASEAKAFKSQLTSFFKGLKAEQKG